MLKKIIYLTVLVTFVFAGTADAQKRGRWWDRDWNDYYRFDWLWNRSPFTEFSYGGTQPLHNKMTLGFARTGAMELKLGYRKTNGFHKDRVLWLDDNYFLVSNFNSDSYINKDDEGPAELQSNLWRFGFGGREGCGYNFGGYSGIILTTGNAWMLAKYEATETPYLPDDKWRTDRYDGEFRWGSVSSAGIHLSLMRNLALNAEYEASIIYPRNLFWLNAGSHILEEIGRSLIDEFIMEIADSSPYAAPIMNVVLKGAFSYGFYTLRKDDMNWPFDTETPLTYESVKVGVTFTF